MTASRLVPPAVDPASLPRDLPGLRAHFRPVVEEIARGALERDRARLLPFEAVRALGRAGFSVLRVPQEAGGPGVDVRTVTALLVDLAAADSNVAHLYRSHLGFLDALRFQPQPVRDRWHALVLAGATVGNASTERGGNALGTLNTRLTAPAGGDDDGAPGAAWTLTGTKYYATGSIFSSHTRVSAAVVRADGSLAPGRGFAVVPVDAPGVSLEDDWDGFGQRLTGTGTAVFEDVAVDPRDVLERIPGSPEAVHEAAWFQLILLAVLAGIARAARDDAAARVAARVRTFNTGLGVPFREDPLIQEAVGRIAAKASAAEAVVLAAADALDASLAAGAATGPTAGASPDPSRRRSPRPSWPWSTRRSPSPSWPSAPPRSCSSPAAPRTRAWPRAWTGTGATPRPSPRTTPSRSAPAPSVTTGSTAPSPRA